MHNQQSFAPSFQPAGQAQYQGAPIRYQPTGPVQSFYQRPGSGSSSAGTGSYHLDNYQGNQPGHDQYLRSDSTQPSSGFSQSTMYTPSAQGQTYSAVYGNTMQSANQYGSYGSGAAPQSYQMSNYRGNEPGHDQYLQSDSSQPSSFGQSQIGMNESYQMSNYRGNEPGHDQHLRSDSTRPGSSYGQGTFQNQFAQPPLQNQLGQTASYQMSNYRGNQPGHDQYLRADSTQSTGFGQYNPSGLR